MAFPSCHLGTFIERSPCLKNISLSVRGRQRKSSSEDATEIPISVILTDLIFGKVGRRLEYELPEKVASYCVLISSSALSQDIFCLGKDIRTQGWEGPPWVLKSSLLQ